MKLKCNINGKEYDIVQGATFSEEYNETLDSGSIILAHIKDRIEDLKAYDDVFIYSDDYPFTGYAEPNYTRMFHYKEKNLLKYEQRLRHTNFIDCNDSGYVKAISNIIYDKEASNISQNQFYYDVQISGTSTEKNCLYSELPKYDITTQATQRQYSYNFSKNVSISGAQVYPQSTETFAFNIIRDKVHLALHRYSVENAIGDATSTTDYIFGGKIVTEDEDWYQDGDYYYKDVEFTDGTANETSNSLFLKFGVYKDNYAQNDFTISRVIFDFTSATDKTKTAIRTYLKLLDTDNVLTMSKLGDFAIEGILFVSPLSFNEEKSYGQYKSSATAITRTYLLYEDGYAEAIYANDITYGIIKDKTLFYIVDIKYKFNYTDFNNFPPNNNSMNIIFKDSEGDTTKKSFVIKQDDDNDKYYIDIDETKYYINETRDLEFNVYYELEFAMADYRDIEITSVEFNYTQKSEHQNFFYKHMLVDDFDEIIQNVSDNIYQYKIRLFSETKGLETVQLPNISITQPISESYKKSIWFYLKQYVNAFSPCYKIKVNDTEWKYTKKYSLDSSLSNIFSDTYSPDFTLNAPNLRDVLSQLMIVKDMIPYVEDGVIKAIDITKINGEFNKKNVSLIQSHLSSQNYCDGLRRNYNGGLGAEKSCHMVEYIGFRNSSTPLMTIDNMRLETSFPIYKINKLYLCYYRKGVSTKDENVTQNYLCTQDITALVKLNEERQMLSKDWEALRTDTQNFKDSTTIENVIKVLSKYYMSTIGYSMESNYITGWGEKYTYPSNFKDTEVGLFDYTKTTIENIYTYLDKYNPYGNFNENYLENYGNIAIKTNGDISDIASPIKSLSLMLKSFFFLVDYEGFYNGTVIQYKDDSLDNITINDNASSSLTLLEKDGLAQKEKVNRFSNKNYNIPARYSDIEDYTDSATDKFDIQKLGSELTIGSEDNIIVYHREYSIYNNCVNATYYASKDYVQKNYFTSVYAKHRTWNLMSFEESVNRQENRRQNILLSTNNLYYENENIFCFHNISNFIQKLFSAFTPSPKYITNDYAPKEDNINYAILVLNGKCYTSDINKFVSGYSLCFNMKMFDNASMGVYVDTVSSMQNNNNGVGLDSVIADLANNISENGFLNYVTKLIKGTWQSLTKVGDDYTGSSQKWYITTEDVEEGTNKKIGFYIGHLNQNTVFNQGIVEGSTTEQQLDTIYKDYIFAFPLIKNLKITQNNLIKGNDAQNLSNVIGNTYDIYKDNKERVDMTFQFDPITNDKNIVFSQWLMKISDFVSDYNKVDETYSVDIKNKIQKVDIYWGLSVMRPRFPALLYPFVNEKRLPFITLSISGATLNFIKDSSQIEASTIEFENDTIRYGQKQLYKLKITLLGKTAEVPTLSKIMFKARYQYEYFNEEGGIVSEDVEDLISFFRGGQEHGELESNYLYYSLKRNYGDNYAYYWSLRYLPTKNKEEKLDLYRYDWNCVVRLTPYWLKVEKYAFFTEFHEGVASTARMLPYTYDGESSQNQLNDTDMYSKGTMNIIASEESAKTFEKNMFVVFSKNELKKHSIYDSPTLKDLNLSEAEKTIKVSDIFQVINNNKIRVNLQNITNTTKSVQYWYYDGKYCNLVFGVNITDTTPGDIERGYLDIYVSSISKRDTRVYDYNHKIAGYIKNYANNEEKFGAGNFYEAID